MREYADDTALTATGKEDLRRTPNAIIAARKEITVRSNVNQWSLGAKIMAE